jgi:hypothetical protein
MGAKKDSTSEQATTPLRQAELMSGNDARRYLVHYR